MLNAIVGLIGNGGGAAGGDFESIQTVSVGAGGSSSVSFTSIPSTYKHLQVRAIYLCANAGGSSRFTINSDTAANYSIHGLQGDGASATAWGYPNETKILLTLGDQSSTIPSVAVLDILDYASTNKAKTIRALSGFDRNGSGTVTLTSGAWFNSSTAVNALTFTPQSGNFNQYSHFALYGIKG